MRSVITLLAVPVLVGSALVGVALSAPSDAGASTPKVTIVDNDGPLPRDGIDPRTADWGFAPYHTTVIQGEQITFVEAPTNSRPHDVVSFTKGGTPAEPTWDVGAKFSSGMTPDTWLRPAGAMKPGTQDPAPNSWVLDSSTLDPGQYTFICTIHPWVVGTLTVLPAS